MHIIKIALHNVCLVWTRKLYFFYTKQKNL